MVISHYRQQRIMFLARLNLRLGCDDQDEIDLHNQYQKNIYSAINQKQH